MDNNDVTQPIVIHPKVQMWQWVVMGFMVGLTYVSVVEEGYRWMGWVALLLAWWYLYRRLSTVLFALKSYFTVLIYRSRHSGK